MLQYLCSVPVISFSFQVIMTSTIQFDDDFRLKTIKIYDKIINTFLALKANWIFF